jgi:hypothetical protein
VLVALFAVWCQKADSSRKKRAMAQSTSLRSERQGFERVRSERWQQQRNAADE